MYERFFLNHKQKLEKMKGAESVTVNWLSGVEGRNSQKGVCLMICNWEHFSFENIEKYCLSVWKILFVCF